METISNTVNFLPLTRPVAIEVEPVGCWYIQHQLKNEHHSPVVTHSEPKVDTVEEGSVFESPAISKLLLDSADPIDLALLDPTAWKTQDHYKLLGLGQKRYLATMDEIKTAYRNKVIKHHPDKLNTKTVIPSSEAENEPKKELTLEEKHFQCIVKAHEILSNQVKRRAYDSIDPLFDDSIPEPEEVMGQDFFRVLRPVFERNSHFSTIQPVPELGNVDTPYSQVQDFYRFWYEFNSWREFPYLDDEDFDPDKAESREEKRWFAKQNKHGRAQLKRNEIQRIIQLVQVAFGLDPRLKKAEEAEKQRREEEKRLKQEKQAREQEERDRRKKEKEDLELREKEQQAEMERLQNMEEKRLREERKQAFKKHRNEFKAACCKHNNFSTAPVDSASVEMTQNIIEIENLCQALSLEELAVLTKRISDEEELQASKAIFEEFVSAMRDKQEEEMKKLLSQTSGAQGKKKVESKHDQWSTEELQLLVKAVTVHPAGTLSRWDVIANYINKHSSSDVNKSGKQVISKVKSMQKNEGKDSAKPDTQAFASFEKAQGNKAQISSEKTINYEAVNAGVSEPWTSAEQKLLEEGLRSFPTTDTERWGKVANLVGTRDEKGCKRRFKEIVMNLQAKKTSS